MGYLIGGNEIQVNEPRIIRVGLRCNIHSSMAYLGIDDGLIEVLAISGPVEKECMEEDMEMWIDGLIPTGRYEPGMYLDYSTREQVQELLETPWVQYKYVSNASWVEVSEDIYWMPVQTFIEHTTIY